MNIDSELIISMTRDGDRFIVHQDLRAMYESDVQNVRADREKLYDMILSIAGSFAGAEEIRQVLEAC
jgi:hypothetical protein